MRLDPNPLFRKVITPWYDSSLACWLGLAAMLVIAFFAVTGISVARQHSGFHTYLWIPILLLALCVLVIVSVTWRLLQRYVERRAMEKEV